MGSQISHSFLTLKLDRSVKCTFSRGKAGPRPLLGGCTCKNSNGDARPIFGGFEIWANPVSFLGEGCRKLALFFFKLRKATAMGAHGKRFLHFFGGEGGGGYTRTFLNILALIDFFKQRNFRKNFVSKPEYYRQHNFKSSKSFKLR